MGKKYIVLVDDNFHYGDETERYQYGEFDTVEEAIEACKLIVETSITYEEGNTEDDLFKQYCFFGEDPFIIGNSLFSGRDYAREYCKRLYFEKNKGSV